jgi:chromate transporter
VPESAGPTAPPQSIPFREALAFWLKLGFVSFGGPAGQIAIMHRELVERRRWLSERRFLHALNYCMLLPGPEAQQLATYLGWLMHRTAGGLAAGLLFILPSFAMLVALSALYVEYGTLPLVAAAFDGIKPAIVAVIVHAAWRIGARVLRTPAFIALAVAASIATALLEVPFPVIVVASGLLGFAGGRWWPQQFHAGTIASDAAAGHAPAILDDDTPPPSHARFSALRCAAIIVVTLIVGGSAYLALVNAAGISADGNAATLTQMARFFTQAALVTFGGAYAVLPYVFDAAVERYGWLTTPQMLDGLALGESTPGPLIMLVAYIGYLGAGLPGALVATFFTFLPSFAFIFAGGPLVESSRADLRLGAALSAITAAIVGVIVNLAVYFAAHVFLPDGWGGEIRWPSLAIGIAAAIALFRFRVGVVPLVIAAALAGLAVARY